MFFLEGGHFDIVEGFFLVSLLLYPEEHHGHDIGKDDEEVDVLVSLHLQNLVRKGGFLHFLITGLKPNLNGIYMRPRNSFL